MRFVKYLSSCVACLFGCICVPYVKVKVDYNEIEPKIPANLSFEGIKSAKFPEPLGLDLFINAKGETYWNKPDGLDFPCILKNKHNNRYAIFEQKGSQYKAWYLDDRAFSAKIVDKPADEDFDKQWSSVIRHTSTGFPSKYRCLFFQKPGINEKFALALVIYDQYGGIGLIKSKNLTHFPFTLRLKEDWFLLHQLEGGIYKFTCEKAIDEDPGHKLQ